MKESKLSQIELSICRQVTANLNEILWQNFEHVCIFVIYTLFNLVEEPEEKVRNSSTFLQVLQIKCFIN